MWVNNDGIGGPHLFAKYPQSVRELSLGFHPIDFYEPFVADKELHHGEAPLANHLLAEEGVSIKQRVDSLVPGHPIVGVDSV